MNYQLVSQDATKSCILFISPLYINQKINKSKIGKRQKALVRAQNNTAKAQKSYST